MPHNPIFSKDDYFKMLDNMLQPQSPLGEQPALLDKLRLSIQKRKRFGMELPKLDTSLFGKS